jgi:hypothetical protein
MCEIAAILNALQLGGPYGLAAIGLSVAAYMYRAREIDRRERENERCDKDAEIRDLNRELIDTMSVVTQALSETRSALGRVEIHLLRQGPP